MRHDALVFDAYGTLFDVHSVMRRCEEFWPGKGAALSQLWRTKQLEYTWQRSLMQRYEPFSTVTREALAYACQVLALSLNEERVQALLGEYEKLAVYPDVPGALEKLPGQKAILSNGSPDMLHPLVSQSKLAFDAVISVDEVKVFKPAPKVYQLAVDRLKTNNIGFVSSNCWDALGAKSFGFAVYWINRTGAPVDRLGFAVDRVLRGLEELVS